MYMGTFTFGFTNNNKYNVIFHFDNPVHSLKWYENLCLHQNMMNRCEMVNTHSILSLACKHEINPLYVLHKIDTPLRLLYLEQFSK